MAKYKVIDGNTTVLAEFDKKKDAINYYKKDLRAKGFISPKLMPIPRRIRKEFKEKQNG